MALKSSGSDAVTKGERMEPAAVVEEILEKNLEDIATVLFGVETNRSHLYDEVLAMVERSLFRIALRRSNHVKSTAASYLGVNRNTFHKKMVKLGIAQDQP
jgi:Fis family transcriptional regulator, factor for inversion stimulation protein